MEYSHWLLNSHLSLVDAALLMCGEDPEHYESQKTEEIKFIVPRFATILKALINAVDADQIKHAKKTYQDEWGGGVGSLIPELTIIPVRELREFADRQNFSCEFLRETARGGRVDVAAARRLPTKLVAANKAWEVVSADRSLTRGRTPKQAVEIWLTAHAAELGLLKSDGTPNRCAIHEISKVVNWRPEGGAPSTKGADDTPPLSSRTAPPVAQPVARQIFDIDDEIPF